MIDYTNFELRDFASVASTTAGVAVTVSHDKINYGGGRSYSGMIRPEYNWDDSYRL